MCKAEKPEKVEAEVEVYAKNLLFYEQTIAV